jgi:hypothetical protein
VITGFNTDIEHDGVVYHVQTEDKGLDSPIILSLVYVGGTILASKRSPYEDLIATGFSDEVLAERLKRQHRLICAAINSGRIDDLKKMSGRPKASQEAPKSIEVEEAAPEVETAATVEEQFEIEYWPVSQEWTPPPAPEDEELAAVMEPGLEPRYEPVDITPVPEPEPEPVVEEEPVETEELLSEPDLEDGLVIELLDDDEFYSGKRYTLRVLVNNRTNGAEKPLANVSVSVKVLGTTFRPLIYTLKTESDGVASISTDIPQFNSGRAAVLIRAVTKDQAAELRRIIHPAG